MDKEVLYECQNGQKIYNFAPEDAVPDSPVVNEGFRVVMRPRGTSVESAERKMAQRIETINRNCQYREYVPCVACTNCIIVREITHGELTNRAYVCQTMKRMVSKFGTCNHGVQGKNGPTVIERDLTMEEIEANKMNLIN